MRKPVVLILGPSLAAVSGVSTHLNQLLNSSLKDEFELCHFQIGSEGRSETKFRRIFRTAISPLTFLVYLIKRWPRIVHFNSSIEKKSFWRDAAYVLIALVLRRRVVYQVHGGALPRDFFANRPVPTAFLRWFLSLPSAVVLLAKIEHDAYKEFLPRARLVVVPNAIDVTAYSWPKGEASSDNPLHLVYVGRLVRDKGIFEIVEAARLLRDKGVIVRVSIAGTGADSMALRAAVKSAMLEDAIAFRGALFGVEKEMLWREANIFVFPTYHREGLPYTLLESMAAGTVPVTCPVGAIPDVIQSGVHGVFVSAKEPASVAAAVARLNAHRAELDELSQACQRRILEAFTIPRLAEDFSKLYKSI